MTNTSFAKIALALAIAVPGVASAQPMIDLIGLTSGFSNAAGGTNVTYGAPGDLATVRWGTLNSPNVNQSGYNFMRRELPLTIDLASGSYSFFLGTFTHLNYPIAVGTSITSVQLDLELEFDNTAPTSFSEFFSINHLETPNSAEPCAAGGANPCPDLVTFGGPSGANFFTVDGKQYQLSLRGFSSSMDEFEGTDEFLTLEGQDNSAYLWADISVIVPEPASFALSMFGLAGLGVVARRRRNA